MVLGIFFGLLGTGFLWKRCPNLLRDARFLFLFGVLVLYILLPLSILSAASLSKYITAPSIQSAQQGFQETGQQLFPDPDGVPEGMMARLKEIPERLEQISRTLKKRSTEMALWTVQLIAGYLFDCILFPLGCFLTMLWGTRGLMRYCQSCGQRTALYREIRGLRPEPGPGPLL
ncbi:MAG: hypothetical protein ACO3NW_10955, partial [Kiritimatiellia bacterium]